jgi:hypothetical protein
MSNNMEIKTDNLEKARIEIENRALKEMQEKIMQAQVQKLEMDILGDDWAKFKVAEILKDLVNK